MNFELSDLSSLQNKPWLTPKKWQQTAESVPWVAPAAHPRHPLAASSTTAVAAAPVDRQTDRQRPNCSYTPISNWSHAGDFSRVIPVFWQWVTEFGWGDSVLLSLLYNGYKKGHILPQFAALLPPPVYLSEVTS